MVDPEFEGFWNTFSKNNKINLYIPEMVKDELLFQLSRSALYSIDKVTNNMANISRITGKQYRHNITMEEINVLIEKRFDRWLSSKKGKVVSTPIGRIDWKEILRMSIWRLPPFVLQASRKDVEEKGFRDTVILETVVDLCQHEKKSYDISFICDDGVLRDTANERLKNDSRFSSYESINDFQSYLKLVNERLKDELVKLILVRARDKFFKVGDSDGYFFSKGIKDEILRKYDAFFKDPLLSQDKGAVTGTGIGTGGGILTGFTSGMFPMSGKYGFTSKAIGSSFASEDWEPLDRGCFFISNPEFDKQEESYYYWMSKIVFARQYMKDTRTTLLTEYTSNNILLLSFTVGWKTKVARDGKFLDFKLIGFDMIEKHFKALTDELKRKYIFK